MISGCPQKCKWSQRHIDAHCRPGPPQHGWLLHALHHHYQSSVLTFLWTFFYRRGSSSFLPILVFPPEINWPLYRACPWQAHAWLLNWSNIIIIIIMANESKDIWFSCMTIIYSSNSLILLRRQILGMGVTVYHLGWVSFGNRWGWIPFLKLSVQNLKSHQDRKYFP